MTVFAHTEKRQVELTDLQWNRYRMVRAELERLCIEYRIPVPPIGPAYAADPCDFTSPGMVRLNIPAAERTLQLPEPSWVTTYARHTFGHYICGLEQESSEDGSNKVADLIADLVRIHQAIPRSSGSCPSCRKRK